MQFKNVLSLVLVLLCTAVAVNAAGYDFVDAEVDGVDIDVTDSTAKTIYVERGEEVDIHVEFIGTADIDDVRVKAEIEGYDDDIEDKTSRFDVQNGLTYTKKLTLEIPDDIDSSEEYTIVLTIVDQSESETIEIPLKVEEVRHDLRVKDILLRPGSVIEAGKPLYVGVRLENLGAKREKDVKIIVSVPELGLSVADYLDRLYTEEQEDDDSDDRNSDQLDDLYLKIPEDIVSGDYELVVRVEYNRGRESITSKKTITVVCASGMGTGCLDCTTTTPGSTTTCTSGVAADSVEAIISIDTTTQTIAQGEGAVYKVMFANLGSNAKVYSLDVTGTIGWANARIDPTYLTVSPGQSGEMYVYVSVSDGAAIGEHDFTINVKSSGNTIKEIGIRADVTSTSATDWGNVRKGLMLTFIVLLIVLVVLGLIVAFGKLKKGDELVPEEPSTLEGQTYYNYPQY